MSEARPKSYVLDCYGFPGGYRFHAGFPALKVPEGLILARDSADPLADACKQQGIGTPRFGHPPGDWDLIQGELVTFTEPQRNLPFIVKVGSIRHKTFDFGNPLK